MNTETTPSPSTHWPEGDAISCMCLHCGTVEDHQIAMVRSWGHDSRPAQCIGCNGEYMIVAKNGFVKLEKLPRDSETYLIRHFYDIGDQGVTVKAPAGLNVKKAAVYMQFHAEEWFGVEKMVTNLGIAAALVTFYGCKHTARSSFGEVIDMHSDREAMCGTGKEVMSDPTLSREGLREFLSFHIDG